MKRQKTDQQKKKLRRRLGCEALEPRHLMAADAFDMLDEIIFMPDGEEAAAEVGSLSPDAGSLGAYEADLEFVQASDAYVEEGSSEQPGPRTNPNDPVDVDASGTLTAVDALLVIDHINHGDPSLTQPGDQSTAGVFYTDVNGDGKITTDDADLVIKALDEGHVVRQRVAAAAPAATAPEVPPAEAVEPESGAPEVGSLAAALFAESQAEGEEPSLALALPPPPIPGGDAALPFLTEAEVLNLLARAAGASSSKDAIIAIVDRGGRILGVRMEQGVLNNIPDMATRVFAIDGAVAKARTAAFFASNQAPLTSRTIRSLSQTTIIERVVESNPTVPNPLDPAQDPFNNANAIARTFGPGTVAPIGVGGHFPPDIKHTPPVDLFNIELQSRDGLRHPGADGIKGNADDVILDNRFNVPTAFLPQGDIPAPESYGVQSGLLLQAQGRGIATMPGGVPLYKLINGRPEQVGGIGVFFPGLDGYATHEQGFIPNVKQTSTQRLNSNKALEAEFIAVKTAGVLGGPLLPGFTALGGRIDLVGITLEVYGPNPRAGNRIPGIETLRRRGAALGPGDPNSGENQIVVPGDMAIDGQPVPHGWLVAPHDSPLGGITAADVERIVNNARNEAEITRAAIRTNSATGGPDVRTKMVIAVADRAGNVLGLFRMQDATIFSIDVAVAKARNTAYYADATALQDADKVDDDLLVARGTVTAQRLNQLKYKNNGGVVGIPDLFTNNKSNRRYNPLTGLAFTNRTFRFLAEPRYPSGVDGSLPPVFSILTDPGTNRRTAENFSQAFPATAAQFTSVVGFDAFHASRNFRDPGDVGVAQPGFNPDPLANQNGIVFFPGSTPLYKSQILVGGFGISGDGVDQDDVVTFAGQQGFNAPQNLRADNLFYRGVRLPFQKFNRNPRG